LAHPAVAGATPYEHGLFRMKLVVPSDYPETAPKGAPAGYRPRVGHCLTSVLLARRAGAFLTKVFHPNVGPHGEICVNALKKDWLPQHGLRHILTVIHCLLINPWPDSALNEEAAHLLLDSYDAFAQRARMMTQLHAKRRAAAQLAAGAGEAAAEAPGAGLLSNSTNTQPPGEGGEGDGGLPPSKKLDRKKGQQKSASLRRL
jgi:ubiquitin-conjugating enzyme E2 S